MTDLSPRDTLTADLLRAQQTGDFAAQAEALMALAEITADEMALAYEEQFFGMLPALYMQACAAYQAAGDAKGMVSVAIAMVNWANLDEAVDRDIDVEPNEFMEIYGVALAICLEAGDQQAQARIYSEMCAIVGDPEELIVLKTKVLRCYEALESLPDQARTLEWLAWSYMSTQPEHRFYIKRALEIYTDLNDTDGQARVQKYLNSLEVMHKKRIQDLLKRIDQTSLPSLFPLTEIPHVIRGLGKLLGWNTDDQ